MKKLIFICSLITLLNAQEKIIVCRSNLNQDALFGKNNTQGADSALRVHCVQKDGTLLFGGTKRGITNNFYLVKIGHDGLPDISFGDNGTVVTDCGGYNDTICALCEQEDGKIIAAGISDPLALMSMSFYRAQSDLKSLQDCNSSASGGSAIPYTIVCHDDGAFTLFAKAGAYMTDMCALVRYNKDGSLDTSFGDNGIVHVSYEQINTMIARFMGNSQPLLDAYASEGTHQSPLIAVRYTKNGKKDMSFGTNGICITTVMVPCDEPIELIIDEDTKRVLRFEKPIEVVQEVEVSSHNEPIENDNTGMQEESIVVIVSDTVTQEDSACSVVVDLHHLEDKKDLYRDKTWWEISDLTRALRNKAKRKKQMGR